MSMDNHNQLHQSSEKYQRRRIRAYIKDIPVDKRQEVLEKILARTILGGDTPCKNALETALKELKEKEKKSPGQPRHQSEHRVGKLESDLGIDTYPDSSLGHGPLDKELGILPINGHRMFPEVKNG